MATILVVDDQPVNREFLVTLLSYGGHRLLEASDGHEGLARAAAEKPDLIITDLLMPTMDGFEFVRQLRADPELAQTRVVFYTATYLETEARSLADACGVQHVLTKPAEPEVVLRVVNALLAAEGPAAPEVPREDFRDEHLRLLTDTLARKAEVVVPRLNAIIDLSLRLSSERDPSHLLDTFCGAARKILGAKYALLGLLKQDTRKTEGCCLFWSGFEAPADAAPNFWPPQGVIGQAVEEGRAKRAGDPTSDPTAMGLPSWYPRAQSFLVVPISSPARRYGWVCLADKLASSGFSDEEEQIATILAALLGRIYENGYFYAEARRHAADLEGEVVERKRVEAALRVSETRFRQLAEKIPEVFWVLDPSGPRVEYTSPAFETVWGRSRTSLYENPTAWIDAIVPEDRPAAIEELDRQLQGHETESEYRIRRPDGTERTIWNRAFPVRREGDAAVERVIGIAVDLTERKHLDEQLRQSHRMEAVGRLAGGIAHDFNNLLGVIAGYSELLIRELPEASRERKRGEEIKRASDRAAALTRQLLAFSRRQVLQPKVLDLNAIVADVEKMMRRLISENIEVVTATAPELGRVRADAGQVEQVLMNLAINARDAMPSGGRLVIETANAELDELYVRTHPEARPGRHVMLGVSDTGTGMDAATMARIFEPFFTTKDEGKGTGLGLATVYGIVRQSGGTVNVYSEPGRGTTFKVYLPRVDAEVDTEVRAALTAPARGTETILLVEDAEALRALVRELLEGAGYTVLDAGAPDEALSLVASRSEPIHLLLTDVVMPRMSGQDLARQIATLKPGARVVFMSGYPDQAIGEEGKLKPGAHYLQKPFTMDALMRTVRRALDAEPQVSGPSAS